MSDSAKPSVIKSLLRRDNRMGRRSLRIHRPSEYLFDPGRNAKRQYSENRLRQIFVKYTRSASLAREYARDRKGRALHELTIHTLRHSHIMHYVHVFKLPLPIVQRQVGHKTLRATSVYLRPSDEHVGDAYDQVRHHSARVANRPQTLYAEDASSLDNDTKKKHTGFQQAA